MAGLPQTRVQRVRQTLVNVYTGADFIRASLWNVPAPIAFARLCAESSHLSSFGILTAC